MKERPILFSAPMVQAILAGNKTQTRRVVKLPDNGFHNFQFSHMYLNNAAFVSNGEGVTRGEHIPCPYGQIGDQLWVRETWGYFDPDGTGQDYESPACAKSSEYMMHEDNSCLLDYWLRRIAYKASFKLPEYGNGPDAPKKWHPSIHMPRWASRIQLQITNIRVERLQDISERDAIREGVERWTVGMDKQPESGWWRDYSYTDQEAAAGYPPLLSAKESFKTLWESINGFESWTANPWVWVIEFKRVEKPA